MNAAVLYDLAHSDHRGFDPAFMLRHFAVCRAGTRLDYATLLIFLFVYAGMILGGVPGLALDRTGVALLGAIVLLALGKLTPRQAWDSVDVPTISLLLGLMVVSSQFRLGGFYSRIAQSISALAVSPPALLGCLILVVGVLSAVLGNDIICLAMTAVLIEGCVKRKLDPRPFLFALACASNVGSAATLIGNPQNILIGESLRLPFARYLFDGGVPAALGLIATWTVIVLCTRGRWHADLHVPHVPGVPFDRYQTGKAIIVTLALMAIFLFTSWPRDVAAVAAMGVLLLSRKTASRAMLGLVDWHLLLLFIGLFVVNHALAASGMLTRATDALAAQGIPISEPGWLFGIAVVLSNIVSNVPAVMLLLPSATHPDAGAILALASTLAGNLFVVGSIANIIVFEQAGIMGLRLRWQEHARIGIPVTLATLAIAAAWLWWIVL